MGMPEVRSSLISALKREMEWSGKISSEISSVGKLPYILVDFTSAESPMTFDGSIEEWNVFIDLAMGVNDARGIDYHRDKSNSKGLMAVLDRVDFDGALTISGMEQESVKQDLDAGQAESFLLLTVECKVYVVNV